MEMIKKMLCALSAALLFAGCVAPGNTGSKADDRPGSLEEGRTESLTGVAESDEDSSQIANVTEPEKEWPAAIEIGKLDRAPIRFQDKGWIIYQNGLFGYLNEEGKWIIEPRYDCLEYMLMGTDSSLATALLYDKSKGSPQIGNGALLPDDHIPQGVGYGGGGVIPPYYYAIDASQKVVLKTHPADPMPANPYRPEDPRTIYEDSIIPEKMPSSRFFVWVPATDEIIGPYEAGDTPSFIVETGGSTAYTVLLDQRNTATGKAFWIYQDKGKALYNPALNKKVEGFETVDPIDTMTFGGKRNGKYEVYDLDLNLLYANDLEGGTAPVGDLVPVKKDGKWLLVNLEQANAGSKAIQKTVPAESGGQSAADPSTSTGQEGIYLTKSVMNLRSEPDYDASKVGSVDEGTYVCVLETRAGANNSIWGKVVDGVWMCLSDQNEVYSSWITPPKEYSAPIMGDIITEHYRALAPAGAGEIEGVVDWKQKNDVARARLSCKNLGIVSVSVNFADGSIEDDNGWDLWYFK